MVTWSNFGRHTVITPPLVVIRIVYLLSDDIDNQFVGFNLLATYANYNVQINTFENASESSLILYEMFSIMHTQLENG